MAEKTRLDALKESSTKAIQDALDKKLAALLDNCSTDELEKELESRSEAKKENGLKEMGHKEESQSKKNK